VFRELRSADFSKHKRCYEIQTALDQHDVPEFEAITEIGMAVRLALHNSK
jgi:hypothetical protein